jgi:lysozyme
MDSDNEQLLIAELRRDEGVRYEPYKDTMGIDTVGVGHNMEAHPLPAAWTFPLTDDQVNGLLAQDLKSVYADLTTNLPWWLYLDDVRQRVLCNMSFNLGINRLLGFRNTLGFVRQGKWTDAAQGMLNSAWATQVGERAQRLAAMMRTGATS